MSATGYQGDGEAVRRVGIEQCVRFLGYLKGFGYSIKDAPQTNGGFDINDAHDAFSLACEYTGYTHTDADVAAIWDAGKADGKRSAAANAFDAGAREFCEAVAYEMKEGFTTYPIECGELVDSAQHWNPTLDLFLCPQHWEEYQKSIAVSE
jgi:hypothetical protein